jgi:hypothetical protein
MTFILLDFWNSLSKVVSGRKAFDPMALGPGRMGEEGAMFQMVDEGRPTAEDKKMFWFKVGAFVVALAALGGVVYFFMAVPYSLR